MDTSICRSLLDGDQTCPELAFNGDDLLVVWIDNGSGLFGSILSRDGSELAPVEFRPLPPPEVQGEAAVAFGGSNYLVVSLVDPDGSGQTNGVFAQRVSQAGVVLDSNPIRIPSGTGTYARPTAVCYDGTDYFVAWTEDGLPGVVMAVRVSQAGDVLDSVPLVVSDSTNYADAAVAAGDSNIMVVWGDGDIHAARVSRNGVVLDTAGITVCASAGVQRCPSVCFDGSDYLVAWEDDRANPLGDIYCARLDQRGVVLDSSAHAVSVSSRSQHYPVVVFDSLNYLILWENYCQDTYNIYGARVNVLGQLLDTNAMCISTNPTGRSSGDAIRISTPRPAILTDHRQLGLEHLGGEKAKLDPKP